MRCVYVQYAKVGTTGTTGSSRILIPVDGVQMVCSVRGHLT